MQFSNTNVHVRTYFSLSCFLGLVFYCPPVSLVSCFLCRVFSLSPVFFCESPQEVPSAEAFTKNLKLPRCRAVFGPRLIRTEVWSRDGVLLQTASRHSHPVDKYGLCGTRLINNYFVETNRSMVVRRRGTQTMSRQFLSGGHRRMFCARDVQYSMHSR
jgi:hypothetical protein